MSEYVLEEPIVLDNGSSELRAGFAGDDGPRTVLPNLIGNSKRQDECCIGFQAQEKREFLSLQRPLQYGIVVDWDAMEKVWDFTFKEMHVSTEHHPVLVGEKPLNPRGNRENLTQMMFERYNTPCFFIALEPALTLYSAGRVMGTIVDVGEEVSSVVPIAEGTALKQAIKRVDIAGGDVTRHLQASLQKKGLSFTTMSELEIVREIKEARCFLNDVPRDISTVKGPSYTLPDGQKIVLGDECHSSSEILFRPDGLDLGRLIENSISSCEIDNRPCLYRDIILSGGTTFLSGFTKRLHKELSSLVPAAATEDIIIRDNPERKYHVWIGGSLLASFSSFTQVWITKSEYDEYGPHIVHRKCL